MGGLRPENLSTKVIKKILVTFKPKTHEQKMQQVQLPTREAACDEKHSASAAWTDAVQDLQLSLLVQFASSSSGAI